MSQASDTGEATPAPRAAVADPPTVTAEQQGRGDRTLNGIAMMLIAVSLFSLMDGFVKWLGDDYPTMQIVFFRSLFAFIPLAFIIHRMGGMSSALRVRRPGGHLLRCLCGTAAMSLLFYAYSQMKLADAVAISFAAPLFITLLSVPMLGEKVGMRRWLACLVGFVGVVIMIQPGPGVFQVIALVPLLGALFNALAMIYVRSLSRTETNASIIFWFTVSTTLLSGAFMPIQWVMPVGWDWGLLIMVGLLGGGAQIAMTAAFSRGAVAVIMPFKYTSMLWAVLTGWLIWGETPGLHIWLGWPLVVLSGLYIVYREAMLRRSTRTG
ncbi:DMT family transporter [Aquibaculum sediminis]|uniref:DMT family transporter n=1 Tax=Aquibaculum sediminis TaxID=3231907 RepID=UPI003454BD21